MSQHSAVSPAAAASSCLRFVFKGLWYNQQKASIQRAIGPFVKAANKMVKSLSRRDVARWPRRGQKGSCRNPIREALGSATMGNKTSKSEQEQGEQAISKQQDDAGDDEIGPLSKEEVEAAAKSKVDSKEEVLVKIPGTLVHLIDEQESPQLASGNFTLTRLLQNGNEIAVLAQVGKDLKWPLLKDEVATKLDPTHYFFSIKMDLRDDRSEQQEGEPEMLSYGVTFKVKGNEKRLEKLDSLLDKYTTFSNPKIGSEEDKKIMSSEEDVTGVVPAQEFQKKKPNEEQSRLYWTAVAPSVEEYSSSIAKGIASGTGQVIRGIFWCSNTTAEGLQKGGDFIKSHLKAGEKPVEVGPKTMRSMQSVRNMTRMTEQVARGILTGILKATSFFTSAAITSKIGQKVFKMMPGEVALASVDAFSKVFDALEMAGENVLSHSTLVTTGIVSHKFGEQAAEFTHEGMSSVGHLLSTAWVITKIRKAINPKAAKPGPATTRGMLKSAAKAAIAGRGQKAA